jgi:hypothetical protein
MNTLTEATRQALSLRQAIQDEVKRHERLRGELEAELGKAETAIAQHAAGLDVTQITRAESVINIRGSWDKRGQNGSHAVADAIADLATNAGRKLAGEYFGVKDYDRWRGQRSDHSYGLGPSHGYIVFAVELQQEARDTIRNGGQLAVEDIEAALYYLHNIGTIADAQAATPKTEPAGTAA